jgi:hypothetical protein
VDSVPNARRDKRRTFLSAIGIVAAVMVLAPPVVQAATQKVNVVNSIALSVKELKGTNTPPDADHGSLPGEEMGKTVNTRTLAAGEGLWGVGVCGHPSAEEREVEIPAAPVGEPDNVISHVIIGSPDPALVSIAAPDLPGASGPVLRYRTTAEQPSDSIDLSGGLRVSPSRIVIDCPSGGTLPSNPATFVVLVH